MPTMRCRVRPTLCEAFSERTGHNVNQQRICGRIQSLSVDRRSSHTACVRDLSGSGDCTPGTQAQLARPGPIQHGASPKLLLRRSPKRIGTQWPSRCSVP